PADSGLRGLRATNVVAGKLGPETRGYDPSALGTHVPPRTLFFFREGRLSIEGASSFSAACRACSAGQGSPWSCEAVMAPSNNRYSCSERVIGSTPSTAAARPLR